MRRTSIHAVIGLLVSICSATASTAQTPQQYVVQVSVSVEQQPDALYFSWPADQTADQYLIYKRIFTEKKWGIPVAYLSGDATSFTDVNVGKGILYEYGFFKKPAWIEDTIPIMSGEQVTFAIHDSWGDGICCWLGFGFYQINALNSILAEGGDFAFTQSVSFTVPGLPQDSTDVILHIYFDGYPNETTWTITHDPTGNLIASGGPYEKPRFSYITAGIEYPPMEHRGTVLLLVDDLCSFPLKDEISRLMTDMVGDGWSVKRVDISRDLPVMDVKSVILQQCAADSTIRTLFLLGHIPVPYSGNIAMDGHNDHWGAWPADVFYGDLDGEWTDSLVNNTNATRPANHNVPGDGKFDQSYVPSDVELEVGRVDLSDLPVFAESEGELVMRYLDKNHAFRHGDFAARKRGLIDQHLMESCDAIGWRNFPLFFTADSLIDDHYTGFLTEQSCLWSFGCSGSSYTGCGGVATTAEFASHSYYTVFTMLFGSYFGDWDNTNNVLRSPLASNGYILTNCWSCIPMWNIHPMAMGFTIGYCTKLTQNTLREYTADYGNRYVHAALMGDPTLRMHVVKPIGEIILEAAGNTVLIHWIEPPDEIMGYYIYRAESLFSNFTRIHEALITDTFFTDNFPLQGNNVYMIRALKLERSCSGSYFNLSQGIFDSVYFSSTSAGIGTAAPLRIYPNPILTDAFVLDLGPVGKTGFTIRVLNSLGKLFFQKDLEADTANKRISICIPGIPAGIYLIHIRGEEYHEVIKMVKL